MNVINNQSGKMTLLAKLLLVGIVCGGAFGALRFLGSSNIAQNIISNDPETVKVSVVTWGGYAGGQYFNRGFKANTESEYYKKYGMKVEFVLQDDVAAGREAFKAGKVDVLWATADSFPTEAKGLSDSEPVIIMQADWSRGGDAIVARAGLKGINDLRGKKVAVAIGTPSHSFLLYALKASDMSVKDLTLVEKSNAVDAASDFKAGAVDAAVVWSPDDEDCVSKVQGATILKNTREASKIIADVFLVKRSYLEKNREKVRNLVEGWLIGSAQINNNPQARLQAIKILAQGLNLDEGLAGKMLSNARLATLGDNKNFFGLNSGYSGITGEKLYVNMTQEYSKVGMAPSGTPDWRRISDSSIISSISLSGTENEAEADATFSAPTLAMQNAPAFSTKKLTITFPSGSATLDENAKAIITMSFVDIAKSFANTRIRVEGNTDNVGDENMNRLLSQRRAAAVVNFLVTEHRLDKNRFVIVGNGSSKPVQGVSNDTAEGRAKNRRTDFELLGGN